MHVIQLILYFDDNPETLSLLVFKLFFSGCSCPLCIVKLSFSFLLFFAHASSKTSGTKLHRNRDKSFPCFVSDIKERIYHFTIE